MKKSGISEIILGTLSNFKDNVVEELINQLDTDARGVGHDSNPTTVVFHDASDVKHSDAKHSDAKHSDEKPSDAKHSDAKPSESNVKDHIATSYNNFSIDNVVTIDKVFVKCINKLNFTLNLINEKKILESINFNVFIRLCTQNLKHKNN